jgi:predicted phage gp36 major capsid-like protein
MAKEYSPPGKNDDANEKLKQHQQNNPQASSRVAGDKTAHPGDRSTGDPQNEYDERAMKEQREREDRAEKERSDFLNNINQKIGEVVNFAGQQKDSNPQLMNLTAEALKNAACQIEAATPQGSSHSAQPYPAQRPL